MSDLETLITQIEARAAAADKYGPRPKDGAPTIAVAPRYVAELIVTAGKVPLLIQMIKEAIRQRNHYRDAFYFEVSGGGKPDASVIDRDDAAILSGQANEGVGEK